MGLRLIGPCAICDRTSSWLDAESELCPRCAENPEAARRHQVKFMLAVWLFWRPLGLLLWFGTAYGLARLSCWLEKFRPQ